MMLHNYLNGPLPIGVPGFLAVGDHRGEVGTFILLYEGIVVDFQRAYPLHGVWHLLRGPRLFVEVELAPSQVPLQLYTVHHKTKQLVELTNVLSHTAIDHTLCISKMP